MTLRAARTAGAYDTTLETVLLATSRRARFDKAILEMAREPQWWPTVSRLQCLRGVSTLTAFGLAVEVGDWSRFSGSTIGAYLGLVPTETSSGQGRHQGSITKTGNTHARRLPVQSAWHHRRPYRPTKTMRDRWDLAPAAARARGHAGNQACTSGGCASTSARGAPSSRTSRSPVSWPAGAGHSRCLRTLRPS